MLRRLVIDGKPDYFAVVFDAPGKTFRDDWYPQYKANRAAMPDDLTRQIEPLHALVRAHGWPLLMVEGVEADDVIGTLAKQACAAGIDTVISSSDKDLAQLVCAQVKIINTMSNDTYDEAGVLAKFDVRPEQVLDLLTLTGDAVDNVPGVAKVGPKTAAKWLSQYGTLDNIIANAHEIGGVVGNNLREALGWLPQGKKLLTVRTDCELPTTGYWCRPSLFLNCSQSHRIVQEEIFGPVLAVQTFRTVEEALEKANYAPYGLSGGVWTDKGSKIFKVTSKIKAGVIWANTYNKFDPSSPFGGYKESGMGREGGLHGLMPYLNLN